MIQARYAPLPLRAVLGALFLWQAFTRITVVFENFSSTPVLILGAAAALAEGLCGVLFLTGFALRWAGIAGMALSLAAWWFQVPAAFAGFSEQSAYYLLAAAACLTLAL